MAADVLRDFLVRLGFKVDDGSLKNFQRSVDVVTSQVTAFAATVAATTASVAIAVEKWSKGFEDLYYASQRTGASAKNIKAFEYAISQVGGTAEGAHAAVESLARFIRNSPGAEGWLKSNGVATRDAAGRMRDTVDILKDFAERLKGQPQWRQNVLAQVIGLDENTRQAMARDFAAFEAEYDAKLKHFGLDSDEATAKAKRFQQQLRSLQADALIIGSIVFEKLAGVARETIDWFRSLNPYLQGAIEWVTGLTVAWRALALAWSLSPIGVLSALAVALAAVWSDYKEWQKTGKGELPWDSWAASLREVNDQFERLYGWIDRIRQPGLIPQIVERAREMARGQDGAHGDRISAAMQFFMGQGWTRAQAAGLAANIDAESGGDPTQVGDHGAAYGIGQWHADRQAAFKRWSGKDITQSSLRDQLNFMQYELTQGSEQKAGAMLRAAQNADAAGRAVSIGYERPLAVQAEAQKRGAAATVLNNSPVINVQGGGDPHATAAAVAGVQTDVNERAARDLARAPQ